MLLLTLACAALDPAPGTPPSGADSGAPQGDGGGASGAGGDTGQGGTPGPGDTGAPAWVGAWSGSTWEVDGQALGSQLGGSMAAGDPLGTGDDLALVAGYRAHPGDGSTRIWLHALQGPLAGDGPIDRVATDACPGCLSTVGTAWAVSTFADLDGDGADEWLVPWWAEAGTVTVFAGGPSFAWTAGASTRVPSPGGQGLGVLLSTGDLDGDGRDELVAPSRSGASLFLYDDLDTPRSTLTWTEAPYLHDQDVLGDVDGDGLSDLGVRPARDDLQVVSGAEALAGDLSWGEEALTVRDTVLWIQVVGDLDGDGRAEVAWSDNLALHILSGEGLAEAWTVPTAEAVKGLSTHEAAPPRPVDLDGDGQHDLVALRQGEDAGILAFAGPVPTGSLGPAQATWSAAPPPEAGVDAFRAHSHWLVAPLCEAQACLLLGTSTWTDGEVDDVGMASLLAFDPTATGGAR